MNSDRTEIFADTINSDQDQLPAGVLNHLPVAVYTCNKVGNIINYNKAAIELWGQAPQSGEGQWVVEKIFKPDGSEIAPADSPMARVFKYKKPIEGEELIIQRHDGTKVRVKVYAVPLFDSKGSVSGSVNTVVESDANTAEEKQAVLAAIVDTSDDTIISKTLKGIITSWNKAAERMFGYTEEEAIGKHISLLIPPERLSEEDYIIGQISRGEKIDHFETIRVTKDGKRIPISLSVSPVKDLSGNVIGASKIARDISERKRADEKQAMLAAIVDNSDDTIISKTLKGIITSWNKAAEKMFGYTEAEAIGKHISLLIPPERLSEEDYIIGNIAKGNRIDHFETIRVAKDGRRIPISLTVSPIKDRSGKIIGASKIARDISFQKQAREAQKRYTEHLEILNSIIRVTSEELDLQRILQKVTDVTTTITGAKFGAFFYNTVTRDGEAMMLYTLSGASKEMFEELDVVRNSELFHSTFSGEGAVRADDITRDPRYGKNHPHHGIPTGHLPIKSYLAVPVFSRTGEVIGGLFLGHPEPAVFTAEHENLVLSIASQSATGLENAKLYQEVKVLNEKKDEFIGLASHELKTPLTSITGYLQILDRLKTDDKSKRFVAKTINQVKKLSSLVSDLLDVSKIEAGKLELTREGFDIKAVVEEAVELIQHSQGSHEIFFTTNADHQTVYGDPQRVEQVVINLLTNAIKYSPSAERVEITLTAQPNEIKVAVKDYGFGIPSDQLDKIFSRFYRIDGISPNISGLGIGLYISHEIIDRHQGKLWAESELGKGSTFIFTLPVK